MNGEPPDRKAGSVRARGAALAFRALAVIVLLNAHWLHLWGMPMVRPAGYLVILVCCLLVFALAGARAWKAPGAPGAWVAATVASWLIIGGAVSLSDADGAHPEALRTALRQVFFLVVLLAAAVGGRAVLRRVGTEPFLKGVLAILIASCVAVPLTPVLRDLGVLPVYRLPHRLPGVFTHHADAGFLGCMTAVLALALLRADGRRRLAYAGLAAGYVAVLASTSRTAAVTCAVVFPFFLTSKGLGARRPLLRWLLAPALAGLAAYQAGHPLRTWLNHPFHGEASCSTAARDDPGLQRDCAALLAARDVLAGGAALNWKESTPLASWTGVTLIEAPARVGELDLRGMDLRGRIPPELGGLSALHVLRLTGNRLTGPIPPELGNLVHLRVLALDANALTGAVPPDLGRLGNLTELRLGGNALTGSAPPAPGATRLGATLGRRVRLWRIGLDRFLESPVVGNGIHTLFLHMKGAPAAYTGEPTGVHNLYLLLAGEAGLVPLALYLGFLCSLLRLHWTAPRSPAADTVVGWTIVLVLTGAANNVLLTLGVSMFLAGLACALAAEVRDRSGDGPNTESGRRQEPARGRGNAADSSFDERTVSKHRSWPSAFPVVLPAGSPRRQDPRAVTVYHVGRSSSGIVDVSARPRPAGAVPATAREPRDRLVNAAARGAPAASRACDYLLVAGPGRSGSTFLLRILAGHGDFRTLNVRDGYYYRSPRRFERALRRARAAGPRAILVDVANAWRDPALAAGIETLAARGRRILVVVLLRDPRERAASSMRFRRSRGELPALLGAKALECAVLRDSLTPDRLARIHGLPADVLTVGFPTLTGDTGRFLDVLAGLCGTARFEAAPRRPVNESVDARNILLSAAGKAAAVALRQAGFPALLERLKGSPGVQRLFFKPRAAGRDPVRLGDGAERALAGRLEACLSVVDEAAERLGDGIWLKRAEKTADGGRPAPEPDRAGGEAVR